MRMFIVTFLISVTILMSGVNIIQLRESAAIHVDTSPEITGISPPYGYVTSQPLHHGNIGSDNEIEILHTSRIDASQATITIQVNPTGNSFISANTIYSEIDAAATDWENLIGTVTTAPDFSGTVRNDNVKASMFGSSCGLSTTGPNTVWEISQCNTPAGIGGLQETNPSFASLVANGGYDRGVIEADIIISNNISSLSEYQKTIRHEFGHHFGLGDLEHIYDEFEQLCETTGHEPPFDPIMCNGSNIDEGDKDGVYFLYPFRQILSITEQFALRASDVATAYLDGTSSTSKPEMVVVYEDYDSVGDIGYVYARTSRDIDPIDYSSTSGSPLQLFTDPGIAQFEEMGAVFGDIDHDGCDGKDSTDTDCTQNGGTGRPDLVVAWIDDADDGLFKVYFDVYVITGTKISWSGVSSTRTVNTITSGYEGMDVVLLDLDSDTWYDDLLVFTTQFDGTAGFDQLFYTWSKLSTSGLDGTWSTIADNNVNIEDDNIGAGVLDKTKNYVMVNYERDNLSPNYMGYKVLDLSSSGAFTTVTDTAKILGMVQTDNLTSNLDGVGGDTIDFAGKSGYLEFIAQWNDGSENYFVVERDTRINSHG